jgi:glycosyltransferase involved in cell wall biosynthesis
MPGVSIVIPAHNPGEFLRAALETIVAQSFTDWEAVVVDDASTEDLSWVLRFESRVRLIRQSHGGASRARNLGILSTSADLVALMDQDDLWAPRKLERQVEALCKYPDAAVCFTELDVFRDEPPVRGTAYDLAVATSVVVDPRAPGGALSPMTQSLRYFARSFVVPSTVMVRRFAFAASGLLDPSIPFSGDFDALIKIGARHPVVKLHSVEVYYRKHQDNYSDRYKVGRAEVRMLMSRYRAYGKATGDHSLVRAAPRTLRRPRSLFAAQAYDCARRSVARRDWSAAARHLANAAMLDPRTVVRSLVVFARARATRN